jgi:hypothetical protein
MVKMDALMVEKALSRPGFCYTAEEIKQIKAYSQAAHGQMTELVAPLVNGLQVMGASVQVKENPLGANFSLSVNGFDFTPRLSEAF